MDYILPEDMLYCQTNLIKKVPPRLIENKCECLWRLKSRQAEETALDNKGQLSLQIWLDGSEAVVTVSQLQDNMRLDTVVPAHSSQAVLSRQLVTCTFSLRLLIFSVLQDSERSFFVKGFLSKLFHVLKRVYHTPITDTTPGSAGVRAQTK